MKNFINKIIFKGPYFLVATLVVITASNDDFLKDELLSDTPVELLYSTPDALESAVAGLYSLNRQIYQYQQSNRTVPLILQAKSDLGVGITGEVSLYSRLLWGASRGDYGTASGINAYWVHYYKIVARCNAIIQGAENLHDIDEARRNQILSEAKAMRANA